MCCCFMFTHLNLCKSKRFLTQDGVFKLHMCQWMHTYTKSIHSNKLGSFSREGLRQIRQRAWRLCQQVSAGVQENKGESSIN